MAKVYLDPGHGGYDDGAVKYVTEDKVNLVMALACRDYLVANGVEVKMSRTTDTGTSITKMANAANAWGADLAVSIHNNAGGGDGFEAYYGIGSDMNGSKGLAAAIEAEVKKIGQNSRGLKTKKNANGADYFGFIRLTKMPAVILEGAFVDNKKDAAQIDTIAEQQAFGVAYAKGILKKLGIKETSGSGKTSGSGSKPSNAGYLVKVKVGALNIRSGPGTNYDVTGVIRDKGVYTIVETDKSGKWGKLKSGKGWIYLQYTKKV